MTDPTDDPDDRTADQPPAADPGATVDAKPPDPRAGAGTTPGAADLTAGATVDLPSAALGHTMTFGTIAYDGPASTGKIGPAAVRLPGYEVLGELGRGGMGVVYKAQQVKLHRLVALKMVLAGPHASPDQLARFQTEAEAVARLQHPNIVQVYKLGEYEGLPYFALEYVEGGPLNKKIGRKPQAPNVAADMVEVLARAMNYAHQHNVVHRDLKPANVLVAGDGTLKIADFGLAKKLEEADGQTVSGSVMGTPQYMSPEQARGDIHAIGPPTDQYALGAILYELLTGRPPCVAATFLDTLDMVRSSEPVPVRQLQPKTPADLETICLKCLQKEPAKRYADCTALADDLRRFLDGDPILARPIGTVERVVRWCRRNPRQAALLGTVAGLLVLLAAGATTAAAVFRAQNAELALQTKAAEVARDDEKEQRKIADDQAKLATQTLDQLVNRIPSIMESAIYSQKARKDVFDLMMEIRKKLPEQGDLLGTADRGLMAVHLRRAGLLRDDGRSEEADREYQEAIRIAEQENVERSSDKSAANLALAHLTYGEFCHQRLKDLGQARAHCLKARSLQRQVVDQPSTGEIRPVEARLSLANACDALALIEEGEPARAMGYCQESLALRRAVRPEDVPDAETATKAKMRLSSTFQLLARLQGRTKAPAADVRHTFDECVRLKAELRNADPGNLLRQRELALALADYGDYLLIRGDPGDAQKQYDQSLDVFRALATPSELLQQQGMLGLAHYRSGTAALKRDDKTNSDRHFQECLKLREAILAERSRDLNFKGLPQITTAIEVMIARARCREHKKASDSAGRLVKTAETLNPKDGLYPYKTGWLFQAACAYALCGAAVPPGEQRQDYFKQSIAALHAAIKAGYAKLAELETDPDLDPIRDEPEFKTILANLKTGTTS